MMSVDRVDELVSALVINYQTPDLLATAVRSFKRFYPHVLLTVIDNGSADESATCIEDLARELPAVKADFLTQNIYHGPAMDRGLRASETAFTLLLDSDTETVQGGFLEEMVDGMREEPTHYGAGHVVNVDRRGFARAEGTPVLSSAHMLLDTDRYRSLPPFIHHGLPAMVNFRAAFDAGFTLLSYPIQEYVRHLGRGTASRYGYGLGFRARVDYVLAKLGL